MLCTSRDGTIHVVAVWVVSHQTRAAVMSLGIGNMGFGVMFFVANGMDVGFCKILWLYRTLLYRQTTFTSTKKFVTLNKFFCSEFIWTKYNNFSEIQKNLIIAPSFYQFFKCGNLLSTTYSSNKKFRLVLAYYPHASANRHYTLG